MNKRKWLALIGYIMAVAIICGILLNHAYDDQKELMHKQTALSLIAEYIINGK